MLLVVTCYQCGATGAREQFHGRISEGLRRSRKTGALGPTGQCRVCRAAHKRAKRRERPVETLSRSSLTKMGMVTPLRVIHQSDAEAAAEAKAAWREWIERRAPDAWVARYYEASGKPWNNPRLSDAEKYKLRYRLDLSFRCIQRVRLRAKKKQRNEPVITALRAAAAGKAQSKTLLQRLGYTREQLKAHIERQFTKRMDWQAFSQGRIHIDHIRPLSAFDLSDPAQFREAFSLFNMRPLWARENMAKGARIEHLI